MDVETCKSRLKIIQKEKTPLGDLTFLDIKGNKWHKKGRWNVSIVVLFSSQKIKK